MCESCETRADRLRSVARTLRHHAEHTAMDQFIALFNRHAADLDAAADAMQAEACEDMGLPSSANGVQVEEDAASLRVRATAERQRP